MRLVLATLALLAAFFIATYNLQHDSLWYDEGWSLWAVHSDEPMPKSPSSAVQWLRANLTTTLARVRGDVHPPLYFLALDGWVIAAGESVFVTRLLSVLFGMIALAATYAVGTALWDRAAGLMSLVILAAASFFVYYTREVRMYTLLMAFASLSTWAYLCWEKKPTLRRTLLYGITLAALIYTHYAGTLVIAAQGLHFAITRLKRMVATRQMPLFHIRPVLPLLIGAALYVPWLPVMLAQIRINNGRPLALPVPTDWGAVEALWDIVTSGMWSQFALPFEVALVGGVLILLVQTRQPRKPSVPWALIASSFDKLLLLLLWLLITPVVLLALNAWVTPVFQIRYNIALLPAGALLAAWGLWMVSQLALPLPTHSGVRNQIPDRQLLTKVTFALRTPYPALIVTVLLLIQIAYTELAMYTQFWPEKSRWNAAVAQMVAARQPLEPALLDFTAESVVAYYDRQMGLRRGISINLGWRDHTPTELRTLVEKLQRAPSVWVVMRSNYPNDWDALAALNGTRVVGYRDSVINVVFYRFDLPSALGDGLNPLAQDHLRFQFGDLLAYTGGIGHQLYVRAGETFRLSVPLTLTTLQPLNSSYTVGVYLTEGYNTQRARWDMPLPAHQSGETITLMPQWTLPADLPPGIDHLRLIVYQGDPASNRLPLLESDQRLYWGTELIFAEVIVDH